MRERPYSPTYLALITSLDQPILGTTMDMIATIAVDDPPAETDPATALVDAFMRECVPRAMQVAKAGPTIDVNLLDPRVAPVAGGVPVKFGKIFCVAQNGAAADDQQAMARAIAASPAMLTTDQVYVPRTPRWCGGMGFQDPQSAQPAHAVTVGGLGNLGGERLAHVGQHCWAIGRTVDYARTQAALERALATNGARFAHEPLVTDGSILRQRAYVERNHGVTRTVLVSGRNSAGIKGPDVEIHILVGAFVRRPPA